MEEVDHVLFGIMLWEVMCGLWFDWEIIRDRLQFRYPLIMYWITKYGTLAFIVVTNVSEYGVRINCQGVGDGINLTSGIGMAGSSCLLMLRAIALWGRDLRVVVPVGILHMGQWAISLHNGFIAKEHWGDVGGGDQGCVFTDVAYRFMKLQFIYTMIFDFVVLTLALWALLRVPGRSTLWKLLFLDGIIYFVLAFTCYLACTIVVWLGISIPLTYMFTDTATVCVSIAACRSFVRLFTGAHTGTTNLASRQEVSTTVAFAFNHTGSSKRRGTHSLDLEAAATDAEDVDVDLGDGMHLRTIPGSIRSRSRVRAVRPWRLDYIHSRNRGE